MELDILYRDEFIIAVDKPAGLVVHRSKAARDLVTLMSLLRDQLGGWVYPAHRLDRGTSGVVLFAPDPEAARLVGEAFAARRVHKEYLAVVRGWAPDAGTIDHPLGTDDDETVEAQTRFARLEQAELPVRIDRYPTTRYSLVRAEPLTGRTHQVRRHLKHIGHPIVGDTIHGQGRHNRFFRERFASHRLLLHAARLSLPHPATGEELWIDAPLPHDFGDVLAALGWRTASPAPPDGAATAGTPDVDAPAR